MAVARVQLKLDQEAVNEIGMDAARRLVLDMTRATLNRANVMTPVRTGRLRAGNDMRIWETGHTAYGLVYNDVNYAAPVHNGAEARDIVPRTAQALRFRQGGRVRFAARVRWPGTKPRPWLTRAMIQVAPQYGFEIVDL
jgi:hypothetical protein